MSLKAAATTTTTTVSLAGKSYELPDLPPSSTNWIVQASRATHLLLFSPILLVMAAVQRVGKLLISQDFPCWCSAAMTPCLCTGPDRYFQQHKRILLSQNLQSTDVVLDVGSGNGMYLPYLTKAGKIVAMEPNAACHDGIRAMAAKVGIREEQLEISSDTLEEYRANHPDQRFDYIILGNVLCEVDNPQYALECVNSMLKDEPTKTTSAATTGLASSTTTTTERGGGGRVFFSEHIGSPPGTLVRRVQDLINPLWKLGMGGCNVNRDTMTLIRAQRDWMSFHVESTLSSLQWVVGLAAKQQQQQREQQS